MTASFKEAAPELVRARQVLDNAREEYEQTKLEVQRECDHPLVVHHAITKADHCSTPRRMCLTCRLEEEGSHWSYSPTGHWSSNTTGGPVLGHADHRLIMPVNSDDFYSLRDPRKTI